MFRKEKKETVITAEGPQIACKNVSLAYDGKTVLKNVTFKVNKGDYLCILGENGTGKSTLIKGLLGLMKPVEGEIVYDDILKNEIGYLPQNSAVPENFPASVKEVVLEGRLGHLGNRFFYNTADKRIAEKNMKLLEIEKLKYMSFSDLSGGQKQRVLLARALCATEKLLLLDEPMAALDPIVTQELYGVIEKLNREHGITVVMISHDTESATKYASHILHLNRKVLFFGKTSDYMKTELSHQFLGGCGHEHH